MPIPASIRNRDGGGRTAHTSHQTRFYTSTYAPGSGRARAKPPGSPPHIGSRRVAQALAPLETGRWHTGMVPPNLRAGRVTLRPLQDGEVDQLATMLTLPGVREWWGSLDDPVHTREGLDNEGAAFAIEVDGAAAGWLGYNEETDPATATPASTSFWRPRINASGWDPLRCGSPQNGSLASANTIASRSTQRVTTSARLAHIRRSAFAQWGQCAATSVAPMAAGTTTFSWTCYAKSGGVRIRPSTAWGNDVANARQGGRQPGAARRPRSCTSCTGSFEVGLNWVAASPRQQTRRL